MNFLDNINIGLRVSSVVCEYSYSAPLDYSILRPPLGSVSHTGIPPPPPLHPSLHLPFLQIPVLRRFFPLFLEQSVRLKAGLLTVSFLYTDSFSDQFQSDKTEHNNYSELSSGKALLLTSATTHLILKTVTSLEKQNKSRVRAEL